MLRKSSGECPSLGLLSHLFIKHGPPRSLGLDSPGQTGCGSRPASYRVASLWQTTPESVMTSLSLSTRWTLP